MTIFEEILTTKLMIMKNMFFSIVLLIGTINFTHAQNESAQGVALAPDMEFETEEYDFGTIKQGVPVTADFGFKNAGAIPLVITQTKGSCGCTVADYTKGEIKPGGSGNISATYNAAALGAFNKTVTIFANIPEQTKVLRIKGEVVKEK